MSKQEIRINNEKECYQLLEIDGIKSDEGIENAIIADIYDIKEFQRYLNTYAMDFLKEQRDNFIVALGYNVDEEVKNRILSALDALNNINNK